MSAAGFASPYTPRQRTSTIREIDATTLPSDAELAHRLAEQVRAKAVMDSLHIEPELYDALGLTSV